MANEVQGPGNYRTGDYPKEPPDIPDLRDLASPTTTSRLEAFMDHEDFPLMLSAAELLFGTVLDFFTTSPAEALVEEQLDWIKLQKMRASGVFSDEDIAQIEGGYKPMVNAVAGNVRSRGLGGSASGAAIVAQAQAAPFHKLQAQAAQLVQSSLVNSVDLLSVLVSENKGFARVLGNITKLYEDMLGELKKQQGKKDKNQGGSAENTPSVQLALDPMFAEFDDVTRRTARVLQRLG